MSRFFILRSRYSSSNGDSCIAISGLASHPFGSWQPKGSRDGSWMWIRDALPRAFPAIRAILFGYDTRLLESNSFQTIADLASFLAENLKASGFASPVAKPLIFLTHSLGGIVFKEMLGREHQIIHHVVGAILFGAPSRGMETQALMSMVSGQPNRGLVDDLTVSSDYLQRLDDCFFEVARRGRMELFWGYETRTSPTVAVSTDDALFVQHRLMMFVEAGRRIFCQDRTGNHPRDSRFRHSRPV